MEGTNGDVAWLQMLQTDVWIDMAFARDGVGRPLANTEAPKHLRKEIIAMFSEIMARKVVEEDGHVWEKWARRRLETKGKSKTTRTVWMLRIPRGG